MRCNWRKSPCATTKTQCSQKNTKGPKLVDFELVKRKMIIGGLDLNQIKNRDWKKKTPGTEHFPKRSTLLPALKQQQPHCGLPVERHAFSKLRASILQAQEGKFCQHQWAWKRAPSSRWECSPGNTLTVPLRDCWMKCPDKLYLDSWIHRNSKIVNVYYFKLLKLFQTAKYCYTVLA